MKKLSFFLMAMLFSVMSFAAETATLSFANKAQRTSFSNTQQIWEQNGITLTNNKANYNNNLGDYANPIRLYANTTIDIACSKGNITQIVFEANADKYVAPMQNSLGTSFGTVTVSGKNVTLKLATPAASVGAITMTAQVRLNSLTVTYEKVASAEPSITCSNSVNFGVVKANANIAKELVVEAENLTENIAVSLATGTAFTVEGDLTTTGGTLTITTTATEEGTYTDKLILTSGDVTKEVEVSAKVVVCQGEGTQENPYTVEDVIKLSNPNPTVTAWVEGYIVGVMNNNELITSEFEVNSNIAIAATADETEAIVPVGFPNGEVRTALNLVDNPDNMGKKVAVYGTLENYFSTTGVKNVSAYEFLPEPVVNHTITVSANPAVAGTVTGGGEFEETDEITVKAVANDGYEFVNWTENEVEVATTAEYTFEVLADRALVANFKEAEPVYQVIEDEITNFVFDTESWPMVCSGGPSANYQIVVFLVLTEAADGTLSYEDCSVSINGTDATFIDGTLSDLDVYAPSADAVLRVQWNGEFYELHLAMSAAAAEPIVVVVENATLDDKVESTGFFYMAGECTIDGVIYPVKAEIPGFDKTKAEAEYENVMVEVGTWGGEYLGNATGTATVSVVDNVVTLSGVIENPMTHVAFDVTISGTLPVVEPTTITWELNGGEFPAVVVPTNEELAMAFKQEYAEYFAIEGLTDTDMNREVGNFIYVTNSKGGDAVKFITENANWKWLHDYILTVAGNIPEGTNVGYYWRANIDGFFHCKNAVAVGGVASADYTEAGKPEVWGAAYEAEYGVVLPTEPVAEDYVLPTPVKEGYKFVGWYDNAAGAGDAYTVIPAGWAGTLYAIWEVEGPGTALENIAVEGKAVKAIINGQLIIIKNGVQYNAQGQVVK